jgi:hypothetical protein
VVVQEDFWQACCSLPKKFPGSSFVAVGVGLLGFWPCCSLGIFLGETGVTGLQNWSDRFGQKCVLDEIFLEQVFLC